MRTQILRTASQLKSAQPFQICVRHAQGRGLGRTMVEDVVFRAFFSLWWLCFSLCIASTLSSALQNLARWWGLWLPITQGHAQGRKSLPTFSLELSREGLRLVRQEKCLLLLINYHTTGGCYIVSSPPWVMCSPAGRDEFGPPLSTFPPAQDWEGLSKGKGCSYKKKIREFSLWHSGNKSD